MGMRLHLFFSVSLIACGGTLRNAAPEPLASSPVPPGFDRFHSSVVHQSIEGSASVGADGNVAVTDVSQRMTLLLHDRGARISFGTVSSAERGGALAHAMQFLRMPTEAVDAIFDGHALCALRNDGKIRCADLESHEKTEITADPGSTRLLALGNHVICAMRPAGDFQCFDGEKEQKGLASQLAENGPAADVIPESPCFVTRDKKLACMDRTFMDFRGVRVVATDVERASVTDSIGDLGGGCAIKSDATVVCWGGFNELGQSGDGKRGPHDGPWNVKGVANAIDVARGPLHACALTKEHAVMCWGAADEYAFGDAALASATHFRTCDQGESPGGGNCVTKAPMGKTNGALHLVPVRVPELEGVVSIAVGADVTCGLRTDGVVLCVGNGHAGPWTLRTR